MAPSLIPSALSRRLLGPLAVPVIATELGFDYSTFIQPVLTPVECQELYAAGMRRCGLAMDSSDATLETAVNLNAAGINLDAYRELAGPGTYPAQVDDAMAGFARLSPEGIACRLLWLTAEDTGVYSSVLGKVGQYNRHAFFAGQIGKRIVGLPNVQARSTLLSWGAPVPDPTVLVPAFRAAVAEAGNTRVGVYTGGWYWPTYMGNTTEFSNLLLWDANYNGDTSLTSVNYGGWTTPFAHQYQSPLSVAGIPLDADVWGIDSVQPPPTPTPPSSGPSIDDLLTALLSIENRIKALQPLVDSNLTAVLADANWQQPSSGNRRGTWGTIMPNADLPQPGTPHFWTLLSEVLVVNALDSVNWVTVLPAVGSVLLALASRISAGQAVDATVILGAVNAVVQGVKHYSGTGNFTIASQRAASRSRDALSAESVGADSDELLVRQPMH